MKTLDIIALTLLIIGGINWGLFGLFGFDLVSSVAGLGTVLSKTLYSIIGAAAVYSLYLYLPILRGEDARHGHIAGRM